MPDLVYTPPKPGLAANVSAETHAITEAVIAWGLAQWPGARAIREVALGDRRIDVLFVQEADMAGVEIKGPRDSLDRLEAQIREYRYWLPQTFTVLDPKFRPRLEGKWLPNIRWYEGGKLVVNGKYDLPRSDLCCSRLLDLLWRSEAAAIAVRTDVIPIRVPKQFRREKILSMLARLLTGHEIMKQVCTELRARPLVGMGSTEPIRTQPPIKTVSP